MLKGNLNWHRIAQLATRRGVNHQAVVNFFINIGERTLDEALDTMAAQARTSEWKHETVAAIQTGILEYFQTEEL